MENICVYFHINPIKQEIFYVGIGHPVRPYLKNGRSKWWHNTVNKYGYEIVVIHKNLTWRGASELEVAYIKQIGRQDLGTGTLINLTEGGEGKSGYKCSDETKKKMSESAKIPASKRKGVELSRETKLKISGALKGNKNCLGNTLSQIHKDNLSKANKGQKRSDEIRAKFSILNGMRGKKHSEETRKKISEAKIGKKLSEEHKNNISKATKGKIIRSEEYRKKLSDSKKGKPRSEETKKKISETLKKYNRK